MTTQKWLQIEPTEIEISKLTPSQTHLYDDITKIDTINCGDPIIHVVLYQGVFYISDGHHRVDLAKLNGKKVIECRLFVK